MKIKSNNIRLQYDSNRQPELVISTTDNIEAEVNELKSKNKELSVEIKVFRKARTTDANSYLWLVLSKMAAVLHTTKDELYIEVLARYGIFTHIVVKPNVVDRVKQEWRAVRELGEVTINGKTGIQLQCFFGSSTYNSAEFAILLDGVISEAKELNIEVISEKDKQLLLNEWNK
jgi:hypothetical protein